MSEVLGPVLGLVSLAVTIFSNYVLIRRSSRFEKTDSFTCLIVSFVLGLSLILLPLYFVGIIVGIGFIITSWVIFLVCMALFLVKSTPFLFLLRIPEYAKRFYSILENVNFSLLNFAFIVAVAFFVFKYLYMLSVKGIFDWDAISLYLPFARHVFEVDHIPLTMYDFQPNTLPVGISVLYAWIHSLSNSALDENFRLFPLLFVVVTMLIIYAVAVDFGSKRIAKIAVIVYTLLPLHDAMLFYASYYPDLCYNALVLASFFFLYKYMNKSEVKFCLLGGLSIGLAALMKPQALYFIPAILFIFVSLVRSRLSRLLSTYLFSIFLGFAFIFIVWSDASFYNALPLTTKILAFLFVFVLTTILAFFADLNANTSQLNGQTFFENLRDGFLFCGIATLIAGLWYLRNYFLTGSMLWSISYRNIPNYSWALGFLSTTATTNVKNSIESFLASLILIPLFAAFLGTLWLIPKIVGMVKQTLSKKQSLLFVWIGGYWLGYFWAVFGGFNTYVLNPRDLLPLAPFFSIFLAFGVQHIAGYFSKKHSDAIVIYLLVFLGLVSLTQSMLIYQYDSALISSIGSLFGSSSTLLTEQYDRSPQALFQFAPNLLRFVSILALLMFGLLFSAKLVGRLRKHFRFKIEFKVRKNFKTLVQRVTIFSLFFIILVAPYLLLTYDFSGGNIQVFGEKQLNQLGQGLFLEILPYLSSNVHDGDVIVTEQSAYALQYYIHQNIRIIDLTEPADLAAMRGIIENKNATEILNLMRELGVRYFLLPKGENLLMEKLSTKSMLLELVKNPRYFALVVSSEGWELYEILKAEKFILGWGDDTFVSNYTNLEEYTTTNSSWSFTTDGSMLKVTVSGNARVSFKYVGIPSLNTSVYHYVAVRVKGTTNARWLFRLISNEPQATSWDFPYWGTPTENWNIYVFDINNTLLKDKVLRADAELDFKSVDVNQATIYIDYYLIYGYEK